MGIFNMFGPSPIWPIEQHMRKVYQSAKTLHPFFEEVLQHKWDEAELLQKKISSLEKEADIIKRDLRLHLPKSLFLPVARSDLLELLSVQDGIANKADDIASLIILRRMEIPPPLIDFFMPFLDCCLNAAKLACKAINELDELLETGFRGNEVDIVEKMILTLDEVEQDSDVKLAKLRYFIFELEKKQPPIEIIFLYKLVQWIGDLADNAHKVGGRLQILIAR